MNIEVDILRTQVPFRLGEGIQDGLPAGGHSIARFLDRRCWKPRALIPGLCFSFHPRPHLKMVAIFNFTLARPCQGGNDADPDLAGSPSSAAMVPPS
jgi:hypothetical protein